MAHVTFISAVVAAFSSLFAVCMSAAAMIVRGADRHTAAQLPLVILLLVFMLSYSADIYITNLSLTRQAWVYEIQEIVLVLLIPALGMFVANHARRSRLTLLLFGSAGAISICAYVIGNFLAVAVWPSTYAIYGFGSSIALIMASAIVLAGRVTAHRVAAIAPLALAAIRIVSELSGVVPAGGAILPAIAAVWGVSFSATELARLVRQAQPAQALGLERAFDRYGLSEREREVTSLLVAGKRYHEIGEALFISKATVKTYVLRVYAKFDVNSKMELVNRLLAERG